MKAHEIPLLDGKKTVIGGREREEDLGFERLQRQIGGSEPCLGVLMEMERKDTIGLGFFVSLAEI